MLRYDYYRDSTLNIYPLLHITIMVTIHILEVLPNSKVGNPLSNVFLGNNFLAVWLLGKVKCFIRNFLLEGSLSIQCFRDVTEL